MGKKSRKKREGDELSRASRKLLKQMRRESSPDPFVIDGKMIYFNPLKKLLDGEKYTSDAGTGVTKEMVKQYETFLKQRLQHEAIAKKNGVDIDKVE